MSSEFNNTPTQMTSTNSAAPNAIKSDSIRIPSGEMCTGVGDGDALGVAILVS